MTDENDFTKPPTNNIIVIRLFAPMKNLLSCVLRKNIDYAKMFYIYIVSCTLCLLVKPLLRKCL